jgi:hypothetical protein
MIFELSCLMLALLNRCFDQVDKLFVIDNEVGSRPASFGTSANHRGPKDNSAIFVS